MSRRADGQPACYECVETIDQSLTTLFISEHVLMVSEEDSDNSNKDIRAHEVELKPLPLSTHVQRVRD